MLYGVCKLCKHTINDERLSDSVVTCNHCGTVQSNQEERAWVNASNSFIRTAIIGTALLISVFYHATQWGDYSLKVVPLIFSQLTNTASANQLATLGQLNLDRGRPYRAAENLTSAIAIEPNNLEFRKKAADIQYKLELNSDAKANFTAYFELGGTDLLAKFYLAKVWAEDGDVKMASRYFDQIIAARPDTFQITVARTYVDVLLLAGHQRTALRVIRKIRKMGANTSDFMSKKYVELRNKYPTKHKIRKTKTFIRFKS